MNADDLEPVDLSRGVWRASAMLSFLLAIFASTSVIDTRVAHGSIRSPWMIVLVSFSAIFCSISVAVFRARGAGPLRDSRLAYAHAVGAACGIALAHLVAFARGVFSNADLVERPRQLVNDTLLVGALLALAWSMGRATRGWLLLWSLATVALYLATAGEWHLDHFAGVDVQRFVVTEIVAAAGSLVLFKSFGGYQLSPS